MAEQQYLYGVPVGPDEVRIEVRGKAALERITLAIRSHPGTGQVRRLVAFVAGCYNG